jgi:hypothetical protein
VESSCEDGNEPSAFINCWEVERMAASQEWLNSVELVN